MTNRFTSDILFHLVPYFNPLDSLLNSHNQLSKEQLREDKKVLLNLTLVSKTFRGAFEPLFKRVYYDDGDVTRRREMMRKCFIDSTESKQVRGISLAAKSWSSQARGYDGTGEFAHSMWNTEDTPELWEYAKGISQNPKWVKDFEDLGEQSETAVLISLMPNLEILHLRVERSLATFMGILILIQEASKNHSILPKLKTVIISCESEEPLDDYGYDPTGLHDILTLPSIQEIEASHVFANPNSDYEPKQDSRRYPPGSSSLQKLRLEETYASTEYLRSLLTAPKALKSFSLEWFFNPQPNQTDMGLTDIVKSLSLQSYSLEEITLDGEMTQYWYDAEEPVFPIGSFKDFIILTTLELPAVLLAGAAVYYWMKPSSSADPEIEQEFEKLLVRKIRPRKPGAYTKKPYSPRKLIDEDFDKLANIFPPSLERLVITEPNRYNDHAVRIVSRIVANHEQWLPNLKSLEIHGWCDTKYADWMDELRASDCSLLKLPKEEHMYDYSEDANSLSDDEDVDAEEYGWSDQDEDDYESDYL